MFEQAFKNIDDILHKDAGSSCARRGMSAPAALPPDGRQQTDSSHWITLDSKAPYAQRPDDGTNIFVL